MARDLDRVTAVGRGYAPTLGLRQTMPHPHICYNQLNTNLSSQANDLTAYSTPRPHEDANGIVVVPWMC